MIKRTLFPLVAGLIFGGILLVTPSAQAACQGYCADHHIKNGCVSDFAGCTMYYDGNGNLENVDCFYVGTCLPD
jgi:hypothetical protein